MPYKKSVQNAIFGDKGISSENFGSENHYVWGKQTLKQQSFKEKNPPEKRFSLPMSLSLGELWNTLSEKHQENIYWKEYPEKYLRARREIENLGFEIEAIVLSEKYR